MTIAFLSALKDPGLRVSATAMLFFGFAGAATGPYQFNYRFQELGLGDTSYAALMFAAAVVLWWRA